MGMMFGLVVEMNPDLPEGDPRRKLKGRAVFQMNNVPTHNWEAAMFQGLGNAPATMEASRRTDCYGCFPGHGCEQSDAEQAYIQAPRRRYFIVGFSTTGSVAERLEWHETPRM